MSGLIQSLVENGCHLTCNMAPGGTLYTATLRHDGEGVNGSGTGDTPELAIEDARNDLCSRVRYRMEESQKRARVSFGILLKLGAAE